MRFFSKKKSKHLALQRLQTKLALACKLFPFPFSVFPAAGLQQLGGAILEIAMATKVRPAILFEGQKERESEVSVIL